ncbi:hypothetical protein LWI28_008359 [Acer negundo]|uniref:Beta-1,3-N-Acetylglucosaminyltransferase family protein n=1 Tax=Acer negundo TaxID=4023 RepID=A0AAD5NRV1_ACENE|nr:hypothetical protein LWI28_008359 [Acer negundo]KAK4835284.1 hypothetical protein QYF36_007852 [Acer negundo]
MANFLNVLAALFFFCFIVSKGYCQCTTENLQIKQQQTGKQVQNKPEWQVTISTGCPCDQLEVKLGCDGFQTVEPIDSSVLAKSGGECLVNNGEPIYPDKDFNFTYAWDTSFQFKTLSSQVACS